MRRAILFILVLLVIDAVASGSALILVAWHGWFGADELRSFMAWTLLFAGSCSAFAVWSSRRQRGLNAAKRLAAAIVAGVVSTLTLASIVTLVIGSWTRAFAFPPVPCWMAGATAGFLAAGLPSSEWTSATWLKRRKIAKWCLTAVCVLLVTIWVATPRLGLTLYAGWRSWSVGCGHVTVFVSKTKYPWSVSHVSSSPGSWGLNWPSRAGCVNGMVNPPVFLGTAYYLPIWIPFVILLIPAIFLWLADAQRIPPGHCQQCGYDLTGNVSGRCPECGLAIGVPISAATEC